MKTHVSGNGQLSVCMLASGSKGNAVYISDGGTTLLIDAGLSGVEIERRLQAHSLDPRNIDAMIVSHEHADHIRGVGILSRRFNIPVYISKKTGREASTTIGNIGDMRTFSCGHSFSINSLEVHPFSTTHDAEDPAGFTISRNGQKIGIATDLGIATAMVKQNLKGCNLLILEANHDPEMLMNGPYPWPLKQRIKGRTGHLSNQASGELLSELKHDKLQHVILAHLSETNNTPAKALREVGPALEGCQARIHVATQDLCGELLDLEEYPPKGEGVE
ncbi:MAG: MBL fold metallo-hydrolase [Deltaproteobacteria bacterium]|nr:MBL fold metallo-hydrolase [Deltaproteobacteria bacterium]